MSIQRRGWLGWSVGSAAAAIGAAVAWQRWGSAGPEGSLAGLWAMRFARPEGGEFVMADFQGKPLVLNFWATWCVPCVRELPALQRFRRDFAAQGWQVLALAVDAPVPVLEFIAKFKLDLTVALAGISGMELMRDLGNAQGGLPFSVVFDAAGRVRQRRLGETKYEELAAWAADKS